MDHSILVLFWLPAATSHDPRLARVTQYSRRVFAYWLEHWRNAALDREAIDLFALFPYYRPGAETSAMVSKIVEGLDAAGDWEPYDAHGVAYRKVTDELWPIVALARNHVDDATMTRALARKREEGTRLLRGDWKGWPGTERFYALSHVYLAFLWTEREGYDIAASWPFLREVEGELARVIDDPELSRANAVLELALFVLSEGGYPDAGALSGLADEVAARQQPDGRWKAFESESAPGKEFASAHATLMALAALDRWSRWKPCAAQREWRALVGPNPIRHVRPGTPPATVFQEIHGQRAAISFPIVRPADLDFINELRAEPENAVVFFRADSLQRQIEELEKTRPPDAAARIAALKRIGEIRQEASKLVPSRRGIVGKRTRSGLSLQVELEMYGPAATEAFADRARRGIERAWQGSVGGLRLSTSVRVSIRGEDAPAAGNALQVYVPNQHVMPSTQREGDTGNRPTTWPPWMAERTIAHEMGHYFGFADAYHIDVRDGFYYMVSDRPADLMSSPFGDVQPAELEQLVQAYGSRERRLQ